MGYKLSDLAIDTIKSLQSESEKEFKPQSKEDIEELGLALSFTYMVAGFGKRQDEEFKALQEKISKVLEELKTHINDIDFDDLNARLG